MKLKYSQGVVSALAAWPAAALASDMTGLLTLITLAFVVAPLTIIHLVVTLVLALKSTYRTRAAAIWHSLIASVAPLVGMAVTVIELGAARHAQDRAIVLLIMAGVLALSWLPLLIHRFQRTSGVR